MGIVRTVTGDVDASQRGVTYAHEHLLITGGMFPLQNKDFLLDDRSKAAQEVETFRRAWINGATADR